MIVKRYSKLDIRTGGVILACPESNNTKKPDSGQARMTITGNSRGFTMIELLLYIALLALVMSIFTSVFTMGIKVYKSEAQTTNLQNENKIVLDRIVKDIKSAFAVEATHDIHTTDTNSTLILKIPAIDASKNLIYEVDGTFKTDRIIFKKTEGILSKIIIPDPSSARLEGTKNIHENIKSISFVYTPNITTPSDIKITLVTEDMAGKETITISNTSRATLRNN